MPDPGAQLIVGARLQACATCLFAGLLLAWVGDPAPAMAQGRPKTNPFPDAYGYRLYDQAAPQCNFDFVDIESSGESLFLTASGAVPAADDGGARVVLGASFELYGESFDAVVISANGYIAAAASLSVEDGGDFSNDRLLPAIPDNAAGVPLRILVYHEELSGFTTGGQLYHEYFGTCPRPSEALGVEACTVIQWADWAVRGAAESFSAQAVLYHSSFEIAVQLQPELADLEAGTIGIQNRQATVALQLTPESSLAAPTAACFFDPRFPSGGPAADLEVSNADTVDIATPGEPVVYEIGLLNRGPSSAAGVVISNPLPAGLVGCAWTCVASEGTSCLATGTGSIEQSVDLDAGAWVDFLLTCDTAPVAAAVEQLVAVAVPSGMSDPNLSNNVAADTNLVGAGALSGIPTGALTLDRDATDVILGWTPSCLSSDTDYAVYAGTLGSFTSHDPLACTTGASSSYAAPTPSGDHYFLVVPTNLFNEGSYGRTHTGQERAVSGMACLPQALGNCPSE